jgi:hypothetical protein
MRLIEGENRPDPREQRKLANRQSRDETAKGNPTNGGVQGEIARHRDRPAKRGARGRISIQ